MDKQDIRNKYKEIRKQLTTSEVWKLSQQICDNLLNTDFWKEAHNVAAYLSIHNEVATEEIYQEGWMEGKIMLLPICSEQDGWMEMSVLSSLEQMKTNRYGILELPVSLQKLMFPMEIDMCIIPGIAFDRQGSRIGFGAGYYDRYLARCNPNVVRVGLAYECQISEDPLPLDQYDLPMDYIVTEKQVYCFKRDNH